MTKRGMSDEDRALTEMQRRRASSEPAADAFDSDEDRFTPVAAVIERAADLTDRERNLLRYVWTHTANMEMRARKRSDSQETSTLSKRIDDVEATLDEKFGRSRKNGDFGNLKGRVDKAESRRWWAITFVAGLVVTGIGSAFAFGSRIGSLESDVATLKARMYRSHASSFQPEDPASKGTPP